MWFTAAASFENAHLLCDAWARLPHLHTLMSDVPPGCNPFHSSTAAEPQLVTLTHLELRVWQHAGECADLLWLHKSLTLLTRLHTLALYPWYDVGPRNEYGSDVDPADGEYCSTLLACRLSALPHLRHLDISSANLSNLPATSSSLQLKRSTSSNSLAAMWGGRMRLSSQQLSCIAAVLKMHFQKRCCV